VKRFFKIITTPSARYSLGALVFAGAILGAVGFSGFQVVIYETSGDEFCLVCHDQDIGLEMAETVHTSNSVGLLASCADCHLPHSFWPKVVVKTRSGIKDTYHQILGTIDTIEKFEARRMHLATLVWQSMNGNDSRECRHCHDQNKWNLAKQTAKASKYHGPALANGKTCIDCHKGIAHKLPEGIVPDQQIEGIDPVVVGAGLQ
jgi:cytochrome c-type protein NapC